MFSKKLQKELKLIDKEKSTLYKDIDLLQKEISLIEQKIIPIKEELNLKDEQYGKVLKLIASDSKTSSETLQEIYDFCLSCYERENIDDDSVYVDYLSYNLEEELSKNINTPEEILLVIYQNYYEAYSSDASNNAGDTMARQSLLIARNLKSTTEELDQVRIWLDDTYIALAKHSNTSTNVLNILVQYKDMQMYINIVNHINVTPKILDKMSCIYDEVDELILKHPQVYVKTKKKINRKK